MWESIKKFFGFGKTEVVTEAPVVEAPKTDRRLVEHIPGNAVVACASAVGWVIHSPSQLR